MTMWVVWMICARSVVLPIFLSIPMPTPVSYTHLEQVEEEATADGIVDMIKKAGDAGIFFVDSKLGDRR